MRNTTSNLNKLVAHVIRERRLELKVSQEELAASCELDRTYISSIERFRRNITLSTLEKIIPHLELSADDFLARIIESMRRAKK